MADEEEKDEGNPEVAKLEKAIKTNRTMFFSLLICAAVIISILITSVLVINLQLANRREVPADEFADLLTELDKHLNHISAIHNAEAQVYFEFQDSLIAVKDLYQHEKINALRQLMIERERDNRKLLDLMAKSTSGLAKMSAGSRDWTKAFDQQVAVQKKTSTDRETSLSDSMKEEVPEPEDDSETKMQKK